MEISKSQRLAVLFDIENISSEEIIKTSLDKLSSLGFKTYPRKMIFNNVSQFKKSFLANVVKSYQLDLVCSYAAVGKNIADFRLYIEALELLHKNQDIDGFCIVSGDADFAELVIKLHLENKIVIGIGPEKKCKQDYIKLFDNFFYLENLLSPQETVKQPKQKKNKNAKKVKVSEVKETSEIKVIEEKKPVKEEIKEETNKEKPVKKAKKANNKKKKQDKPEDVEIIIRTDDDKNDLFYQELSKSLSSLTENYKKQNKLEVFCSKVIHDLRSSSPFLASFTKISFDDIRKCGYVLLQKAPDRAETTFISIETPVNA